MPAMLARVVAGMLLAATMNATAAPSPAPAREIIALLLADPTHAPHAQLLKSVKRGLEEAAVDNVVMRVTDVDGLPRELARASAQDYPVVIAVGGRAAAAATQSLPATTPLIYALISRARYDALAAQRGRSVNTTAIFRDQPFTRRLRLLRASLPMIRRIGIVVGPASAPYVHDLRRALAHTARLDVQMVNAPGEVMPALKRTLVRSDAILALPDPLVYNPRTMKGILLTTYRHRVPLIGLSQAYVRAGAITALDSTPAHVGAQLAELLAELARSPSPRPELPAPAFPRYYDVAVNPTVANSLGIHLLPANELRAILSQQETDREPLR